MFNDNGIQLKNYGIQLQNMGIQIQNIGFQMNNMVNNFGSQLQNFGLEIANIGMKLFNIGTQISNIMISQNMPNIMANSQCNMIPQNFNIMNQINQIGNENSNKTINCIFRTINRPTINIALDGNKTVEEVIKIYTRRVGISYDDIDKNKIYFLDYLSKKKFDKKDQKKIKDFYPDSNFITIEVLFNKKLPIT